MWSNRGSADERRVGSRTWRWSTVSESPWTPASDEMRLNSLDGLPYIPPPRQLPRLPRTRPRTLLRSQTTWPHDPFVLPSVILPPPPALRSFSLTSSQEKLYDSHDPTLRFVDREDELDFLYEGFTSRRALMSCGHAVTPTSLTNWCLKLLDDGESRFVCGQTGCNVEWSYEEVCKMALLTPEEKKHFEKAMSSNAARANTRPCPGCESPVVRTDLFNLRVHCSVCSVNRSGSYDFCWQCLREWKGPDPRSDRCDNDGCCNQSVKTLLTCPYAEFQSVEGVSRCPSIRACPTCGILLQHDNTECKNVVCPRCKVEFCFVCLKLTDNCVITSDEFEPCYRRVAPRQTSIPVWWKS
ncbi:probable E3 ubiquitin-protein ligase RNF144A-A isoform X2 [Betta splendens]|uniref:Probable E3 ubiquitin-protein ligase RNF144A-A isoform X2 n=1 Tax=Betta splendens TaxID=158456 RepID=A0A6P7LKW9_BETSP|nr:probable E3 ubiquitin-protein ligase RNF144A-A isoform X2 [Betta splendens]